MDLKQLFLQTSNANDNVRKNAESQLKSFEKNLEFINYVKNVLMKDSDKMVQHITSLWFMNTVDKNWKVPELAPLVKELEETILSNMIIEDKYPKLAYIKILQCILEHSEKEKLERILNGAYEYLKSTNVQENNVAICLYDEFYKSNALKFNSESYVDIMFNKLGTSFTNKFTELITLRRYNSAATCMKVLSKAYSNYQIPEYLCNLNVFKNYFDIAVEVLKINEKKVEGIQRLHKWAVYFLYKIATKGIKKYFKDADLITFVRSEQSIERLYQTFSNALNFYLSGEPCDEKFPITIANFFTLCTLSKITKHLIKTNYMHLISNFILPIHKYDGDIKEAFEYDADAYLSQRYNYYNNHLLSETEELFNEILNCDKEIENNVIVTLQRFLDSPVDEESSCMRFAVVGLLSENQKGIIRSLGEDGFYMFVQKYIFTDLVSPHSFLVSQALHFLSVIENYSRSDNFTLDALSKIVSFTSGDNAVLAVEACLSLNCFFYNEDLRPMFKPIIASLFEKILLFTKQYFIESLSVLSDSIIDCYNDEISSYAPLFAQSICTSFMDHIEEDKDEHMAAIAGCITTIEKLIMSADDKPEIVKKIYDSACKIIFYVFKNLKYNYFQESIELMNSFLFVLRVVDQSMFEIFVAVLSSDEEELCFYPRELADFIDNFLTFGKDNMININTLELVYRIINMFIPLNSAESDVYDEDFEAGCRIIDSLMLNTGSRTISVNPNIVPAIVHKIVANFDYVAAYETAPLYALESLMNCFIVTPDMTMHNLNTFTETFFNALEEHKKLFVRVYDKKLFILFTGALFKLKPSFTMFYEGFAAMLADIIATLPAAISKRNKLQEKEDSGYYGESEEDSEYTADIITEDIYFVTILDSFDAYEYCRAMLSGIQANTIGQEVLKVMTQENITRIRTVLESPQEAQK